jgi:hypothetical protein
MEETTMINIINHIDTYPWQHETIPSNKVDLTVQEFLKLGLELGTSKAIAEHLNTDPNTVSRWLRKGVPEFSGLGSRTPLNLKIYFFFGQRPCSQCKEAKELSEYGNDKASPSGAKSVCRECESKFYSKLTQEQKDIRLDRSGTYRRENPEKMRVYSMNAQAKRLKRIPAWSETEEIKEFYSNCPQGYEVDHIIPLQGKKVSGLHVLGNLQYLTIEENRSKSNRYEI